MKARRLLEELFTGEGALPRPEGEVLAELAETIRTFGSLPAPPAGGVVAVRVDRRLRRERGFQELFTGEDAVPVPSTEELAGLLPALHAAAGLDAPRASSRVAAGLRRRLIAWRRFQVPRRTRAAGFLPTLRQGWRESWVVRGLAAALLLHLLALPGLGAVIRWQRQAASASTRTGISPPELFRGLLPAPPAGPRPEERRPQAGPREVPAAGPEEAIGAEATPWISRENQLRERGLALAMRFRPEVRLNRLRRAGASPALDRWVQEACRDLGTALPDLADPGDSALALRALLQAGHSERHGPLAMAIGTCLGRLGEAWRGEWESTTRILMACAFLEANLASGGAGQEARLGLEWIRRWASQKGRIGSAPVWALAEAAAALVWAPLVLGLDARPDRDLLAAELEVRMARGGSEGEAAAAALLRVAPGSPAREEQLRLTLILRSKPEERAAGEPWVLVHLAWGLLPPSGAWAEFSQALRRAFLAARPETLRERALWVLALAAFYAAPEERPPREE